MSREYNFNGEIYGFRPINVNYVAGDTDKSILKLLEVKIRFKSKIFRLLMMQKYKMCID